MPQCKVKYCTVTRGRGFSTFAIPDPKKEYERCALWLKNIGNPKLDIQTYEYSKEKVVCEKHFESRYFKEDIRAKVMGYKPKRKVLTEDAVPTIIPRKKTKKKYLTKFRQKPHLKKLESKAKAKSRTKMAEETVSLNGDDEATSQLSLCVLCTTDLKDKSPKLLSCLHSLCENCLNSLFQLQVQQTNESENVEQNNEKNDPKPSTIICPACNCTVEKSTVIDNRFIAIETPTVIEEDEEEKEEIEQICTGCEESQNAKATSFCNDCHEYLCDECVFAHKRVRMTKDHTIVPKDDVKKDEDIPDTSKQKMMYCTTHKQEALKLFCETCDKLTCRDCQLLEHKDHKYQFLQEAISKQRENLQNAVVGLKNKLGNYKQANEILKNKHSELRRRMTEESDKMLQAYEGIVAHFKKYIDSLVSHLEKYVTNKTTIISEKQRLVAEALLKMQHSVDFVENALTVGDDVSLLYSKGNMIKNLKLLSESGIPFQPSFLNYSISYDNDIDSLMKHHHKLGCLNIDGSSFPPKPAGSPNLPQVIQTPTAIQHQNRARVPVNSQTLDAINAQIRERIRHLPPEQQPIYEAKLRQRYQLQQQAQIKAQQAAQQSRNHNNQVPHMQMNNHMSSRPSILNRNPPVPQQLMKNNQYAMSAAGNLAALAQQRHGIPPPYRNIAPAPGMKPNIPNQPQFHHNSIHTSMGGAQNGIPKISLCAQNNDRAWTQCRLRSSETTSSPGAQAAAYANKTPSPAGAGFDHQSAGAASQPSNVDQLQAWASQTVQNENQKFKLEERSSCAFSSSQDNKKSTPPPLIQPSKSQSPIETSNPPSSSPAQAMPIHPPSTGKSMPQSKEEDPNEDWCAVCQNGGDLLCCDKCPKVYHLKCHVPELSQFPCGEWQCTLCRGEEEIVLKERESKEVGYIPGTKRKAPTGLTDHEKKTCERILLELYIHEKSTVFHEPVSKAVPNYYKIITNPIDFSKIRAKLQRVNFDHYRTVEDFIADVKLVFKNCAIYNAATSEIGIAGKTLEEEFERLVQKYLPCYMDSYDEIEHRQTSPSSDTDTSKAKKSKHHEHDIPVTVHLH